MSNGLGSGGVNTVDNVGKLSGNIDIGAAYGSCNWCYSRESIVVTKVWSSSKIVDTMETKLRLSLGFSVSHAHGCKSTNHDLG